MKTLFWVSLFWVAYAYGGYLLLLFLLGLFKRNTIKVNPPSWPDVTMIIAAYNEEASIASKVENCLKLDYPKEKFEVIIVSDASADKTDEIVSRYASSGIKLLRMAERKGKTAAQNYAATQAKGEILVFSDATTIYRKDAIRKLIRNFRNPKVGIVAGEEEFIRDRNNVMLSNVRLSWDYEKVLRRLESRFNSLIGVSGCIFAIRRGLYEKLDERLIEDFALPLRVLEKGYKVKLEENAIGYEEAVKNAAGELKRKSRIVSGGVNVIWRMKRLLNPLKHPRIAFQLVSHKIFRWLAPLFFITLFLSNIALIGEGAAYTLFFYLQAGCYLLAVVGYGVPFHFCLVNLAAIIGIFKFLFSGNKVIWEPLR